MHARDHLTYSARTYTHAFCVNRVRGKEDSSKQRGLRSMVPYPAFLIIGQSTNQYRKHVDHKGGYDSMEDDVQHMEADRVQASCYEVVQPAAAREKERDLLFNAWHMWERAGASVRLWGAEANYWG